jgi:hypothetical protein
MSKGEKDLARLEALLHLTPSGGDPGARLAAVAERLAVSVEAREAATLAPFCAGCPVTLPLAVRPWYARADALVPGWLEEHCGPARRTGVEGPACSWVKTCVRIGVPLDEAKKSADNRIPCPSVSGATDDGSDHARKT